MIPAIAITFVAVFDVPVSVGRSRLQTVAAEPTGRNWLDGVTLYARDPESSVRIVGQLHLPGARFEKQDRNYVHHSSPVRYVSVLNIASVPSSSLHRAAAVGCIIYIESCVMSPQERNCPT